MITFEILGTEIGANNPPYIIAELSGNHNGSLKRALDTLTAAKNSGANAVKIQTYTASTMTLDVEGPGFTIDLPLWKGKKLYDVYKVGSTPWEWHSKLFERARQLDITMFSSPFDFTAVDFLEKLEVPAYKIASAELLDIPLIEYVARTGKPIIMSTGMASLQEISEAVEAARMAGCKKLCLLHCTSAYPTPAKDSFLSNIKELSAYFEVIAGISDHSLGTDIPLAAVALGASVVEKHFTLDRSEGGIDSEFSIEPAELAGMVTSCKRVKDAIGVVNIGPKPSEIKGLKYRRSLYFVKNIKKGELITKENVRSIRPGYGLKPKFLKHVIGKVCKKNISKGTPVDWDIME